MNEFMKKRLEHINSGRPLKEKKKYTIPKVSKKRSDKIAEQKAKGSDSELDLFFDAMIKRCTGKCLFCNSKTTAVDHSFYRDDNPRWSQEANDKKHQCTIEKMKRASVAHLLPKRPIKKGGFPSVATNEENWIELCWNCHTLFDTGKITWEFIKDSKEWDIIKEKLLNVLPVVVEEERKHKLYSKLQSLVYGR